MSNVLGLKTIGDFEDLLVLASTSAVPTKALIMNDNESETYPRQTFRPASPLEMRLKVSMILGTIAKMATSPDYGP